MLLHVFVTSDEVLTTTALGLNDEKLVRRTIISDVEMHTRYPENPFRMPVCTADVFQSDIALTFLPPSVSLYPFRVPVLVCFISVVIEGNLFLKIDCRQCSSYAVNVSEVR